MTVNVNLKNGILNAQPSVDPDYPGIDIEFLPYNEDPNALSRPRILFEQDQDTKKLRAVIWDDSTKEDFTEIIDFN